MDTEFYGHWLEIGVPENRLSGSYESVSLCGPDGEFRTKAVAAPRGVVARHANLLRNGNCYIDLQLPAEVKIAVRQITESKVTDLFNCGRGFLASMDDGWALYSPGSDEPIAGGPDRFLGGTPFCYDSGFFTFEDVVQNYNLHGELISRMYLPSGSDMERHEVALANGYVVAASCITYASMADGLPGNLEPAVQLESALLSDFVAGEDPRDFWDAEPIHQLAFAEVNPVIPVYLNDLVIQPFTNHVGLFSLDLKVQTVIQGDFVPVTASAGLNSIIYMIADNEDGRFFVAIDLDGRVVFRVDVPGSIGALVAPPMVASSGAIYLVGSSGFVKCGEDGEVEFIKPFTFASDGGVYPLLYNDNLTLAAGSTCVGYDPAGEIIFEAVGLGGKVSSPMLADENGNYFVGTDVGIVGISLE